MNSPNTNTHIIQLDGLRFIAVLMVMIGHWMQWQWSDPWLKAIPLSNGVTLFFVLSGFLITRILITNRDLYDHLQQGKKKLIKIFYIRRFLRIFPLYYFLIFILFIFNYDNTREVFVWLVTYTTNIYHSLYNLDIASFSHLWSLAVEEQFYLFWPFVILFLKPKKTLPVILLTIILSLTFKAYLFLYTDKWMANSFFTLSCMHALGLGALLAYIQVYLPQLFGRTGRALWFYSALSLYIIMFVLQKHFSLDWYKVVVDEFVFAAVSFFAISRASQNEFSGIAKWILQNPFSVYSGKISYGLYVYHMFIPPMFTYFGPRIGLSITNPYLIFTIMYFMNFIISSASWWMLESPINKLKKRFPYFAGDIHRKDRELVR